MLLLETQAFAFNDSLECAGYNRAARGWSDALGAGGKYEFNSSKWCQHAQQAADHVAAAYNEALAHPQCGGPGAAEMWGNRISAQALIMDEC
jgi:hypothetical protein